MKIVPNDHILYRFIEFAVFFLSVLVLSLAEKAYCFIDILKLL